MKLSVPYNGFNDFMIGILDKYNHDIQEVYLAPSKDISLTGRHRDACTQYKKCELHVDEYNEKIKEFMTFASKQSVETNLLFNGSSINFSLYTKEGRRKVMNYIDRFYSLGILNGITVTDPYFVDYLCKEINTNWTGLKLHASVNMHCDSVNKLKMLEEMGFYSICIDRDINRDIEKLKIMKHNSNLNFKLMVNEGCILSCIYRKYHHELREVCTSDDDVHANIRGVINIKYNEHINSDNLPSCLKIYRENYAEIFRSPFIRPEDLDYYSGIADVIKIAGREMDCERLEKIIKAYITKQFDGNLWELIFRFSKNINIYIDNKSIPHDYFHRLSNCKNDCHECSYCNDLTNLVESC